MTQHRVEEDSRDYLGFSAAGSFVASDSEIESAVAQADLPSLLATLAMLTRDEGLISPDLQPPLPPMGVSIKPHGGMSEEAQRKARGLCVRALAQYRDRGCPAPALDESLLEKIMAFLAKGATPDYLPLLKHELALPRDFGTPDWTKQELAADREFRVAVIGAGFSGIAAAYRLQQAGVDYVVYEKRADVGGVWRDNVYPGCRLDTPNFAYSLSFAQKANWPQQFSQQAEIWKYAADVASETAIKARFKFQTEVISLTYDDTAAVWTALIRGQDGAIESQQFHAIITAVGQLNRPSIPKLPGLESFQGQYFHSCEWPEGLDLRNKRVAVVGTGASAYQIVPSIVDQVAELKVFQRNSPWMLPTPNYHDDIKPGLAFLLRHVPYYGRWFRFWQFWIAVEGRLPSVEVDKDWDHPISVSAANERLRLECMAHLEAQLAGRPDLLEKMTPSYPPGAKRMLRDNGVWGQALKRPNAELIVDPMDRVSQNAILTADGKSHEVDIIVFATGFLASDYLEPIKVFGREGRDLHQWWAGDCRAYLGITVPQFPNLFMIGGPNTGSVVNGSALFSSECEVEYVLSAIGELLAGNHAAMDIREEAFWSFNDRVDAGNLTKAWGVARVSSWYRNSAGRASQTWPFSLLEFWKLTAHVDLSAYELLQADGAMGDRHLPESRNARENLPAAQT